MASGINIATTRVAESGGGLAALRKAAGYRSGREFARALGISPSTYARYERDSEGANIPTKAAWLIADKLSTSIDAVVGRGSAPEGERDLNALYRSLSDGGKARFDEYVQFLDFRERVLAAEGR